jgi:hypothetical protein
MMVVGTWKPSYKTNNKRFPLECLNGDAGTLELIEAGFEPGYHALQKIVHYVDCDKEDDRS